MKSTLSAELYWVINTAVLTAVLWVPHIVQRIVEMGPYDAFRDPRHDQPTRAAWAQRVIRAHSNAVENLAVFGLLAMAVHVQGLGNGQTAAACAIYFVARAGHYVIYVLGVPWMRTPVFLVGFLCQMTLAARALGVV